MRISSLAFVTTLPALLVAAELHHPRDDQKPQEAACPDYAEYATQPHPPYTSGPMKLSFQRPPPRCRTFHSDVVEDVIARMTSRMKNVDLARLFENAFPSTLDTTIKFHTDGSSLGFIDTHKLLPMGNRPREVKAKWQGVHTFVITGDITAEWLRDSTNQLAPYRSLVTQDEKLLRLIQGAVHTQAEFVIESPYCNAFMPPPISGLPPKSNEQSDIVQLRYDPSFVFECKYELDSLAHFLQLATSLYRSSGSTEHVNDRWILALKTLLRVLDEQSLPTFNETTGDPIPNPYTFERQTRMGTETLSLRGIGNPLGNGTGLIRSAFRPSDDATIFGFLIPSNAQMAVELQRTADMLEAASQRVTGSRENSIIRKGTSDNSKNMEEGESDDDLGELAEMVRKRGENLAKSIWEHGVVSHAQFGQVFAYEVDGYGSQVLMDDANYPSLLALPVMGFCEKDDPIYQNTRRMLLSHHTNPYYYRGREFSAIGGPHAGLGNAWPMSLLIQAQTSDDDEEIMACLDTVLRASPLGLIRESVDVHDLTRYTRSWFAWANGVFADTILDLAERKPHLIFDEDASL